MDVASLTLDALLSMRPSALHDVLRHAHPIDPHALDDTEYRGVSLGLPSFVEKLTWKTFKKTFHRDPRTGVLRGWNVRIEQEGLHVPFRPKRRNGVEVTFGHYHVVDPAPHDVPEGCDRGLLIHYGLGGNAPLDPLRRVRDPIVALREGQVDLLLGASYVDLGFAKKMTPSYFLLERDGALTHVAEP